jgi:exopolysaccharide production protein ExoQ
MEKKIFNAFIFLIDVFLVLGTIPFLSKYDGIFSNIFVYLHSTLYYVVIYICLLIFIGNLIKKQNKFNLPKSLVVFFLFLMVHSILFSSSMMVSLSKVIILLGTCLYSLSLIKRYSFTVMLKITLLVCIIINTLTLIYMYFEPALAFEDYNGKAILSGTFPNKNNFATYVLFSIIVSLSFLKTTNVKFYRIIGLFTIVSSIGFLLISGSVTSLITLIVIVTIFFINNLLNRRLNIVYMGILINFVVYLIINLNSIFGDIIYDLFERDITLTGRTFIWDAIITQVGGGLIFGYGYGTFWGFNPILENNIISNYSNNIGGVTVQGAHNGFLELMLQIGIIGVLLLVFILILSGNKLKKIKQSIIYTFSSFYLIYILMYFITERSLWNMGYQTLFLFMVVILIFERSNKLKKNEVI